MNQALHVTTHVIVDEEKIRPHVFTARLSLVKVELIPKWSGLESIKPCRVQQNEKQQHRCESNVTVNYRFNKNHKVLHFVLVDVSQQDHAVQEATYEEERLHEVASVYDNHGEQAMVALQGFDFQFLH